MINIIRVFFGVIIFFATVGFLVGCKKATTQSVQVDVGTVANNVTVAAGAGAEAGADADADSDANASAGSTAASGANSGPDSADSITEVKYFFVTKQIFHGNLGGIHGADHKCLRAAEEAGLTGTWVALLTDSSSSPFKRVKDTGPWSSVGGSRQIEYQDLNNFSTETSVDEFGQTTNRKSIWTGMASGFNSSHLHCSDWNDSSPSQLGAQGISPESDNSATSCEEAAALCCLQQ